MHMKRQGRGQAHARFGRVMKEPAFDKAPEFEHFRTVMRGVLLVSKDRLDELVREAKEHSARNGDPHAPGQKPRKKRRRLKRPVS